MINLNDLWRLFVGFMIFFIEIVIVRILWDRDERLHIPPIIDRFFNIYHKAMYPSVYKDN